MERVEIGDTFLFLEMLADVDKTIDQLFELYLSQGKTELFEEMCPYFGTLWAAGKVLTQDLNSQLESGHFQIRHKKSDRLLEIGCGLALPSLLLSQHGWEVAATDLHPDVPLFLEANRRHNGVLGPRFVQLDWRHSAPPAEHERWDLILASDVLYDKTQPETLIEFLSGHLSATGRAIVADPGRTYVEGFFELLRNRGFDVTVGGMFGVIIAEIRRKGIAQRENDSPT